MAVCTWCGDNYDAAYSSPPHICIEDTGEAVVTLADIHEWLDKLHDGGMDDCDWCKLQWNLILLENQIKLKKRLTST